MLPLLVVASLAGGCRSPVGVERVDARRVHRSLTANVLTTGEPSAKSRQVLSRRNLRAAFEKRPEETLAELRRRVLAEPDPQEVLALAELSFTHAEAGGGRPYYLAAAVYAYGFLFPGPGGANLDPLDPRLRLAANLYNRGLTAGLMVVDGDFVDLRPRTLALPFGELVLEAPTGGFGWVNHHLEDFVPVAELEVRGLRNRYRRPGIGAPLAARIGPRVDPEAEVAYERWLPISQRVACTAFLRLGGGAAGLRSDRIDGTLELFIASIHDSVTVDGREVPLELETTAALAFSLTQAHIWDIEIPGFLGRELEIPADRNLVMITPHRRGRIPVVLVHGTASSPARWAELANEILADARLRARYEIWLFFYNTGNPILYSAQQLRKTLTGALSILDPEGRDPGLQRLVVIGHSQGGLLTKLQVVDGGDPFWWNASDVPIEDLDLSPETAAMVRDAFYFEAIPQVRRVIFISTPHGGSYLAGRRLGVLAGRLVRIPGNVARAGADLFEQDETVLVRRKIERVPSSIDNMTPGHPFLVTLHELPLADGVTGHSIIAVLTEGPPENKNDGVVAYRSAHIEGVASEKLVISGHSVQGHPDAVAEVRRILLEHLDAHELPDGR